MLVPVGHGEAQNDPFGPSAKGKWDLYYEGRISFFSHCADMIQVDPMGNVQWPLCGHFLLLPVMPQNAEPENHVYECMTFMGVMVPLKAAADDPSILGTWEVVSNWSLMEAHVSALGKNGRSGLAALSSARRSSWSSRRPQTTRRSRSCVVVLIHHHRRLRALSTSQLQT